MGQTGRVQCCESDGAKLCQPTARFYMVTRIVLFAFHSEISTNFPGRRNSRSRSPDPRRSRRHGSSDSRSRSRSSEYDRYKRSDRRRSRDKRNRDRHSRSRSYDRFYRRERRQAPRDSHRVSMDERDFIELVATMTRTHGKTFENSLLERERGNPPYEFLYSPTVSPRALRG